MLPLVNWDLGVRPIDLPGFAAGKKKGEYLCAFVQVLALCHPSNKAEAAAASNFRVKQVKEEATATPMNDAVSITDCQFGRGGISQSLSLHSSILILRINPTANHADRQTDR